MKFYCDSCNTKYAIADEKVRGKVLKVRCKKCDNVITVREQQAPAGQPSGGGEAAPAPRPASFDPRRVPWHYSLNGESFGPFRYEDLRERFARGDLGDECYVWTESFSGWKPVSQVDAFEEALATGRRVSPRPNTIGASQGIDAVRTEQLDADKVEPTTRVEQPGDAPSEEGPPERAAASHKEAESSGEEKQRRDRLSKLRTHLAANSSERAKAADAEPREDARTVEAEELGEALVADGGAKAFAEEEEEEDEAAPTTTELDESEQLDAHAPRDDEEALSADSDGNEGDEALAGASQQDETSQDDSGEVSDLHDGLFSEFDEDYRDAQKRADAGESDRVPFPAEGAELGEDADESDEDEADPSDSITGSLLIQLDKIQKEGRGKKLMLAAVVLLIVGGLTAAGFYAVEQVKPEPRERAQAKSSDEDDDTDELVIRTYSEEEQQRIRKLSERRVGDEEGEAEGDEEGVEADEEPAAPAPQENQKSEPKAEQAPEPEAEEDDELGDAFESARKREAKDDSFGGDLDEGGLAKSGLDSPIGNGDGLSGATSGIDSNRNDSVYNPTDSLEEREQAGKQELSREELNQGIRMVQKSVGACRQRHARRSAELDARKVYMTLRVKGSGRVADFDLEPNSVRQTEFERCLKSHRGRWKFPSFDAPEQKFRAPFIIQ